MKLTRTSCSIEFVIGRLKLKAHQYVTKKKRDMDAKQNYLFGLSSTVPYEQCTQWMLHIVFILHIYIRFFSFSVLILNEGIGGV